MRVAGRRAAGIDRALASVRELVDTFDTAEEPKQWVTIASVVRESLARANGTPPTLEIASVAELEIHCARHRVAIAIANVIRNARQAGARSIVVRGTRSQDVVLLAIDDDGPGVPLALRDKIFDHRFTTRAEGLGLGLTLVREVVRVEHGGEIEVGTSPEGGARFTLALPHARMST